VLKSTTLWGFFHGARFSSLKTLIETTKQHEPLINKKQGPKEKAKLK
jgi:hypothetical protein